MNKIIELLGNQAEYYLNHTCKTIDKSLIHVPSPDTIDKIWIDSDRNIQTLRSLQTLLGHGRLANTGTRSGGSSDAVFTPELTKTSKDSKRERDRENKNKKKEFEKGTQGRTQTKSGRTQTEFQNPESTSETESTAEAGREETGDQGDHHSGEAYYP